MSDLGILSVFGIALSLAMDAFAVAISAGLAIKPLTARHVFRLSFHFGLFQFLMPVTGWLAGRTVSGYIGAWDHWVAFALLTFIGGKMLLEAITRHEQAERADPTRGLTLVTLSVATSLDALAVGLSMAFLEVPVWYPSLVIGLVAAAMTCVGVVFGSRLGGAWGRRAEVLGGLMLLALGAKILIEHMGRAG